jgi:DNA-binding SARP family transcriptional activator
VGVDTRKAVALFAYLAVTKQRHTRDTLAALLWPEYDQSGARATLRRTLSALNKALEGDRLDVDRETIGLAPSPGLWLDVDAFHERLAECSTHGHPPSEICPRCRHPLEEAAALYRDDFMAGFGLRDSPDFDEWQYFQAEGLRRELAGALEQLVRSCVAARDFAEAIRHARRWLALDRLHEPAHRQLMLLYAWSGRRSAALQQYRECAQVLEQELGVEPLEATTQLYTSIKENRAPAWEVAPGSQERLPESELSARPRVQSDLVGRAAEWSAMLHAYEGISAGGRVVALTGEAGIGKTRLAEEFLEHALANGAVVATAYSYEGETALAYGPVVALLRGLLDRLDERAPASISPQWLSEAARLVPEIAASHPGLPPSPPLDTPGAQSRFFEGIRQVLLGACSGGQPGVLFFDDLQWADTASIDLLTYLVRRLDSWPICLLLAWRSDVPAAGHLLGPMLAPAQRSGLATLLPLGRLSRAQVEELAQRAVDDCHPTPNTQRLSPAQLAERLYRETEGLPFFLVEYMAAISGGLVEGEQEGWSLPGGVRYLLRSRLMAVGETGKQLLNTAAVIGRSFDFDTLREASGRGEEETIAGLEELIGRGLVAEMRTSGDEPGGLLYDFSHEKLRALVYEETSLARRRLLHRRVAEALSGHGRSPREEAILAGQIAYHYKQAGEDRPAADYYKRAGERARALYANAEAISHFQAALALGHPDTGALHEAIGDLYTLQGEYTTAVRSYQTATSGTGTDGGRRTKDEGGAATDDPAPSSQLPAPDERQARIAHKLGGVYLRRGEWELAERHFERASRALEEVGAGTEGARARVLADWSLAAYRRGHVERAVDLANQALDLAGSSFPNTKHQIPNTQQQDRRALAQAHNMLGILASHSGDLPAARSHLERSLELAEELQDPGARVAALNNLALALQAGGDVDRAVTLTEEAIALSASQGDRHREAALHNNLADLLHSMGRSDDSMHHLKQAVAIYAEIGVEAGDVQPAIWKLAEW